VSERVARALRAYERDSIRFFRDRRLSPSPRTTRFMSITYFRIEKHDDARDSRGARRRPTYDTHLLSLETKGTHKNTFR